MNCCLWEGNRRNEDARIQFLMITFNTVRISFLVDTGINFFKKSKQFTLNHTYSTATQMSSII